MLPSLVDVVAESHIIRRCYLLHQDLLEFKFKAPSLNIENILTFEEIELQLFPQIHYK